MRSFSARSNESPIRVELCDSADRWPDRRSGLGRHFRSARAFLAVRKSGKWENQHLATGEHSMGTITYSAGTALANSSVRSEHKDASLIRQVLTGRQDLLGDLIKPHIDLLRACFRLRNSGRPKRNCSECEKTSVRAVDRTGGLGPSNTTSYGSERLAPPCQALCFTIGAVKFPSSSRPVENRTIPLRESSRSRKLRGKMTVLVGDTHHVHETEVKP
jgi:hypothetical protein